MDTFTVEIISDTTARVAETGEQLVASEGKTIHTSIHQYSQERAVKAGSPVEVAVQQSGVSKQIIVSPDGSASRAAPTGPIETVAPVPRPVPEVNEDVLAEPVSVSVEPIGHRPRRTSDGGRGARGAAVGAPRGPVSALAAPEVNPGAGAPARLGLRGRLNAVLGLSLNPKADSAEMRLRMSEATITSAIPDFSVVTVANTKGGVGKTPLAVALSQVLAALRGGSTIACADLSEVGGSLANRVGVPPAGGRDVVGLLEAHTDPEATIRPSALSRYLTRQPSGEDIVPGRRAADAALSYDDAERLAAILAQHRDILVADTGNSALAGSWRWAVSAADVLVVPVPLRYDAAEPAEEMLLDLAASRNELLSRTIVVITEGPGDAPMVEKAAVDAFLELGVRQVLRMPFEPLFATGERIFPAQLRATTTQSLTVIAAAVVELMAAPR
ncbi:ParA family protein [Rhodococcus sp. USK13]|uniref:ParA family protein n=1 Tax=Rhodococcus sp. USK13 TaxID=2806442 RepID=UPI001BD0C61C|nr:ParA family protein [Rhodococcus sp. USK13]